ncbi:MAG: protein kinase [Planctomycetes bacterium]|nr:protein kinase [Planctomycetota bacterium]MBI3833475.1 protein kinase [Planctomycetota bacterium]
MSELSPEQFRRAERVFHEAKALPESERIAHVQAACGDDIAVRVEVNQLLRQIESPAGLDELGRQACDVRKQVAENKVPKNAGTETVNLHSDATVLPRWESPSDQSPADTSPTAKAAKSFPKIDGYRITGVLGQGGMGIVYRAVQTKLNRAVALKVLPAMVGNASPNAVARFRREATAAARLHHTNIVPIYDFGESRDAYYYAMELVEGQPLDKLIDVFTQQNIASASPVRLTNVISSTSGGPMNVEEIPADSSSFSGSISPSSSGKGRVYFQQMARWMAEAADALNYAHSQNIVHRDIKPANLILSNDGRIMITDFGLAKSSDEKSVTMTGALLGTIRHISPEQAMARRMPVDHRTDIWSLGTTMYELLCLVPAFPGSDEKQVLAAIITKDPVAPRKIVHAVPQELETICLKTLEKAVDQRYPTARALAEDLRNYLNDLPIVAKRPGPIARVIKFTRRHRALVIGVVSVLVVAGMSAGYVRKERARHAAEVDSLLAEGKQLMLAEKWDDAEPIYANLLHIEPRNVDALTNLAIIKKEQYNNRAIHDPLLLDNAVDLLNKAIAADPTQIGTWNTLGVIYKMKGSFDDARDTYKKALDLQPTYPYAWDNLGVAHALRRDLGACQESLEKAAELAGPFEKGGDFCDPIRDLAMLQLVQNNVGAVASAERAVSCAGDKDPLANAIRARIHLTLMAAIDNQKALEDATFADRLAKGKHAISARYLALAHLRLHHFEEAVEHAKKAIELQDKLPTTDYLIIAIANANLGRMDDAKKAHEAATSSWPRELQNPEDYIPDAPKGILWFETGRELIALRGELQSLLLQPATQVPTKNGS